MGVVTASSSGGFEFGQNELRDAVEPGQPVRQRLPVVRLVLRRQQRPDLHPQRHARPQRRGRQRPGRRPRRGRPGPAADPQGHAAGGLRRRRRLDLPLGLGRPAGRRPAEHQRRPGAGLPALRRRRRAATCPGEGGALLVLEDAGARPRARRPADLRRDRRLRRHLRPAARQRTAARPAQGDRTRPGRRRVERPPTSTWCSPTRAALPELDRIEADAITAVFGPRGVPVTAPKTMTGRLYSGAAPLDLAAALPRHPGRRDPAHRRHPSQRRPTRSTWSPTARATPRCARAGARPRPGRLQLGRGAYGPSTSDRSAPVLRTSPRKPRRKDRHARSRVHPRRPQAHPARGRRRRRGRRPRRRHPRHGLRGARLRVPGPAGDQRPDRARVRHHARRRHGDGGEDAARAARRRQRLSWSPPGPADVPSGDRGGNRHDDCHARQHSEEGRRRHRRHQRHRPRGRPAPRRAGPPGVPRRPHRGRCDPHRQGTPATRASTSTAPPATYARART